MELPQATPLAVPAAVDSDGTVAPAPNAKAAAGSAPAKTNIKSQGNSKPAQRAELPIEGNRNVIAPVATSGQPPAPLPIAINLPFGNADALPGQQSDTNPASTQPQTSASGFQSAGIAAGPPDAPSNSSQQTSDDEMKAFNGTGTAGITVAGANELAFAAKVQPGSAVSQPSLDSSDRSIPETPAVAAPAIRKVASDASGPRATESAEIPAAGSNAPVINVSSVPSSNVTTAFQQPDSPTSSSNPKSDLPAEPAADLQVPQLAQPPASAAPLKDVSLRIEQPQGQNMEVRVIERAGEVRVAVRGGDSDVVQGLRQNLSELADRLSENGFRAETWRPAASEASATPSENKGSPGNSGGDDSQQQQRWSQQGRGQRDQNQSNRPPWVQELETSLTSGTAPTG
jgi:hypothetical protein